MSLLLVAQRVCASHPHAHRPQATQQIQLPRWVQAILRLPGGVIILALIMLPITLVRVCACLHMCCWLLFMDACFYSGCLLWGLMLTRGGLASPASRPSPWQWMMHCHCPPLAPCGQVQLPSKQLTLSCVSTCLPAPCQHPTSNPSYQTLFTRPSCAARLLPTPLTKPSSPAPPPPPPLPWPQIVLALMLALTIICIPIQLVCNCLGCAPQPPPQGAGATGGGADDATQAAGGLTQVLWGGGEGSIGVRQEGSAGANACEALPASQLPAVGCHVPACVYQSPAVKRTGKMAAPAPPHVLPGKGS